MSDRQTPPLDELLAHAHWARALARRLVLDEHRADDVVQQAWLAAVEKPPSAGPGLRAWWSRLIRNLAHNQRRADLRRVHHEQGAAVPETTSSATPASSIVDEFAAQRLVADALLRLEEPYRETLLRRWYRDEKPAAIARATGVPVKTVETRLARGLERLRAELTALRDGNREGWLAALMPLLMPAHAGAAVSSGGAIAAGALAMTATTKFVAAGVIAAAAAAGIVTVRSMSSSEIRSDPPAVVETSGVPALVDGPSVSRAGADRALAATDTPSDPDPAPVAKPDLLAEWRGDFRLHGRVLDEESGLPLEGAYVHAGVTSLPWSDLASTTTDASGEFTFERLSQQVGLSISKNGYLTLNRTLGSAALRSSPGSDACDFPLTPLAYATVRCRLRPIGGGSIPPRIDQQSFVSIAAANNGTGFHEYFVVPNQVSKAIRQEMTLSTDREGDCFVSKAAPARIPLVLLARVDNRTLGTLDVGPLRPDETHEFEIPIQCGILVRIELVNEVNGVVGIGDDPFSNVALRWTSTDGLDHLTIEESGAKALGAFVLPGPGRLKVTCDRRGYAPKTAVQDVSDGDVVRIELARWRRLEVKIATRDGEPHWSRRMEELALSQKDSKRTTSIGNGDPDAFDRYLDARVVPAGAELPHSIEPLFEGANRGMPIHPKVRNRFGKSGFEVFVPFEPLMVGIYADGEQVGFGAIDADDDSVTIDVDVPPISLGALRFRLVRADNGRPIVSYHVVLWRMIGVGNGVEAQRMDFEVEDLIDGMFAFERIPAGRYTLSIGAGQIGTGQVLVGSRFVTVEPEGDEDLGDIEFAGSATVNVTVVDEKANPLCAQVRVFAPAFDPPLWISVKGSKRTSARTPADGSPLQFGTTAGKLRIEAESEGFEPGTIEVEASPLRPIRCSLTLRRAEPPR